MAVARVTFLHTDLPHSQNKKKKEIQITKIARVREVEKGAK